MSNVLIIGATSAIAIAFARQCASRKDRLFLVARNATRLQMLVDDLQARGAVAIASQLLDVSRLDRHVEVLSAAVKFLKILDVVLIAHGSLPDQQVCETNPSALQQALQINGNATINLLALVANRLQSQHCGALLVISSVAGDRGRASNYVYGAAKAAVSTFASGLRNRLYRDNVRVITVKPGFVDTPMTVSFDKGLLWAQPETIARGMQRAIDRRRNVVYLPAFWRWIMWLIRAVPESIFKRLSL
ncbi:MAG TPA: SDR family oxidoreductase [Gammaproteobacteria bacterium]|nr:SDR family oxidoreductase [Gammaproteobacteria bacterium]